VYNSSAEFELQELIRWQGQLIHEFMQSLMQGVSWPAGGTELVSIGEAFISAGRTEGRVGANPDAAHVVEARPVDASAQEGVG